MVFRFIIFGLLIYTNYFPLPSLHKYRTNEIPIIKLDESTPSEKVAFSSHFTNLRYIKLETNNEILLGEDLEFELDKNNVFISDGMKLLRFDVEGKFLNSIGALGKGPGEYNIVIDFFIEPSIMRIFILDPYTDKLLEYRYGGEFIQDYKIDFKALCLEKLNNSTVVIQDMFFYEFGGVRKPTELHLYDINSHMVIKMVPTNLKKNNYGTVLTRPIFYHFQNKLMYKNQFERYVCSIDVGGIKQAKYSIEETLLSKKNRQAPSCIFKIQETENQLILTYVKSNKGYRAVYDKGSKRLINVEVNKNYIYEEDKYQYKYSQGLVNDFDGGLPFWPDKIINDSVAIDFHYAYDFLYVDEKGIHDQAFQEILKDTKSTDNPVIMIADLK